jgi:hypothetical protein
LKNQKKTLNENQMKTINYGKLEKLALTQSDPEVIRRIGRRVLFVAFVSILEIIALVMLYTLLMNVWSAIIIAYVTQVVMSFYGCKLSLLAFTLVFKKYPEVLSCIEDTNDISKTK